MSKSHNVIGSYSVRPKYLRDALESATCLQEYITKVNENQNKITRICMFSMEDINDILIDQYLDEEKATEVKKTLLISYSELDGSPFRWKFMQWKRRERRDTMVSRKYFWSVYMDTYWSVF